MIDLSNLNKIYDDSDYALVIGAGKSGVSTCQALEKFNKPVYLSDDKAVDNKVLENIKRFNKNFQGITTSEQAITLFKTKGIIIPSPGIPLNHPLLQKAKENKLPILGDVELFSQCYPKTKTIGITGTNGKSTTTALITHILNQCGVLSIMGGNIGDPIMSLDITNCNEYLVLELSSFQLDLCSEYSPDIAVLLNISPDHLDRHGNMKNYIAAKEKIFNGYGQAVIGIDDEYSLAIYNRLKAKSQRDCYAVSIKEELEAGVFMKEGILHDYMDASAEKAFEINSSWLSGKHNQQNISVSYVVARLLGLESHQIIDAILSFKGLPHRQFRLGAYKNVTFINDSKATNAEAASKALDSFSNIYWIVGGRPKEGGLKGLEPYMSNVKHAFIIGEAQQEFSRWFSSHEVPFILSDTIELAVNKAFDMAINDGEEAVLLLSPACASFDQFCSFEERGEVFSTIVSTLKKRAA